MSGAGRPRRYDAADEIEMIFDAALTVMQRNGYQDAAVAEILTEAGLSTRSFYRHFQSKDELLCALYRRDTERAVERLDTRLASARTPLDALEAWVDEILSFGFERAKARRAAVLSSMGAMRADGWADESRRAAKLFMTSLEHVLEQGRADGSMPTAEPSSDARVIWGITSSTAGFSPLAGQPLTRADARRAVLSFVHRALGTIGR